LKEREEKRSVYTHAQLITSFVVFMWFEALRAISHHQKKKPNHTQREREGGRSKEY
jgi:hypothetical protein